MHFSRKRAARDPVLPAPVANKTHNKRTGLYARPLRPAGLSDFLLHRMNHKGFFLFCIPKTGGRSPFRQVKGVEAVS